MDILPCWLRVAEEPTCWPAAGSSTKSAAAYKSGSGRVGSEIWRLESDRATGGPLAGSLLPPNLPPNMAASNLR